MGDRVSVREMARRRGCTHGAVQKAISDGRIPDSAVEREDGRIKSIDFEAATIAWNSNTDVDQASRSIGGAATVAGAASGTGELPLETPTPKGAEVARGSSAPGAQEVREANAEGKRLQNQLLELELLKETGALVSREEVREIAARRYRAARDQILTVPDRVADILAAERDPARVHAVLTNELEQALHGLSGSATAESAALAPGETSERVAA
jgi:hypothetical protein